MILIGIDSDTRGSICRLDTERCTVEIYAVPSTLSKIAGKNRRVVAPRQLRSVLQHLLQNAEYITIEKQNARPGQGVTSMFSFGFTYGVLTGMVEALVDYKNHPVIQHIPGREWKARLNISADKEQARIFATALAPEAARAWKLKKHTSAAEAFLIALYGGIRAFKPHKAFQKVTSSVVVKEATGETVTIKSLT